MDRYRVPGWVWALAVAGSLAVVIGMVGIHELAYVFAEIRCR